MKLIIPPNLRLRYVLAVSKRVNYEQIIESLGPGYARQTRAVLAGKGRITERLADRLCEVYPVLNREWLLTGDVSIMQGDIDDERFRESLTYKVCVRPCLKRDRP